MNGLTILKICQKFSRSEQKKRKHVKRNLRDFVTCEHLYWISRIFQGTKMVFQEILILENWISFFKEFPGVSRTVWTLFIYLLRLAINIKFSVFVWVDFWQTVQREYSDNILLSKIDLALHRQTDNNRK